MTAAATRPRMPKNVRWLAGDEQTSRTSSVGSVLVVDVGIVGSVARVGGGGFVTGTPKTMIVVGGVVGGSGMVVPGGATVDGVAYSPLVTSNSGGPHGAAASSGPASLTSKGSIS